ncbi:MAG: hypothetical protein ACRESP_21710 [Pseudomonas sp.]
MNPFKLMLAGVLITTGATAATADQPGAWPQEPKSFMGVNLQGDFLERVSVCPPDVTKLETPCRMATESPDVFLIQGAKTGFVFLGYQLFAHLSGSTIEKLVFTGPASSSELVANMLRTDYGPPVAATANMIKLNSGATFVNEVLLWQSERLLLKSQRDEKDIGTYSVILTIAPTALSDTQDQARPSTSNLSKL